VLTHDRVVKKRYEKRRAKQHDQGNSDAEEKLVAYMKQFNIHAKDFSQLFVDKIPCGQAGHMCSTLLADAGFSNAQVVHASFPGRAGYGKLKGAHEAMELANDFRGVSKPSYIDWPK
jgi:hypothetical protein